jgi:hypothetical protein
MQKPNLPAFIVQSLKDLRAAKKHSEALRAYHWKLYSELAYQRRQIEDQLLLALNEGGKTGFAITGWQRAVKYKYSLHPLSTLGSLSMPGGRFNLGEIDPQNFPTFSALYIASDKDTALQETLGQTAPSNSSRLTPQEIALTSPQSQTIVSVSGEIERVFDLRAATSLSKFARHVKTFTLSSELSAMATKLGLKRPKTLKTSAEILGSLLNPDWRRMPMEFDIPADSQIFGHLVYSAGIDGIVYPSRLTGKDCIVLFPRNFQNTSSFIQLDDDRPHPKVPHRIDSESWELCESNLRLFEG